MNIELYSSLWHLISALLVLLAGSAISVTIGQLLQSSTFRSLAIYSWHTLLCIIYCLYTIKNGGDSIRYYTFALERDIEFKLGTLAIDFLTAAFVNGLGLSFLGAFLVYNIFGSIGLQLFDASLRIATKDKSVKIQNLATLIIFLPSVSFWSSAIGKDSLSFLAVSLSLWAAQDLNRRGLLMAISVVIMLLVRPHMAGIMVMSLTLASLSDSKASFGKKFLFASMAAAAAAAMIPFALQYAGINGTVNSDTLINYVEGRQAENMVGGGSVDIAGMSFPMQLFTYMFRPIIFEARNLFSIAAAIDNLILMYLFLAGWRILIASGKTTHQDNRIFMWSYAILAWTILALTTANLGIALRQKWMFAPILIFLFISAIGNHQRTYRKIQPTVMPGTKFHRNSLNNKKPRRS